MTTLTIRDSLLGNLASISGILVAILINVALFAFLLQ